MIDGTRIGEKEKETHTHTHSHTHTHMYMYEYHNDTQYNDIQHNHSQNNDIQHNNKLSKCAFFDDKSIFFMNSAL
jgi:hypothetical protein